MQSLLLLSLLAPLALLASPASAGLLGSNHPNVPIPQSEGLPTLPLIAGESQFEDSIDDKSPACEAAINSLASIGPTLNHCFSAAGLYYTPAADICGITPGSEGCLDVTIRASQILARACTSPGRPRASLPDESVPFAIPDVYRNWANPAAAAAACHIQPGPNPRPCITTLTDLMIIAQGYQFNQTIRNIESALCSSSCAQSYYRAVNGFANLAPTLYGSGADIQDTLFTAFSDICPWARTVDAVEETTWARANGYGQITV